jgi:N-acetylglucosamine kinase-like BadF-type ATPase
LLQHGTEFTSALRPGFGKEHMLDSLDVARIFDIRLEALAAVARMIDGRREATPLKQRLLQHYGIDREEDFSEKIYRMSRADRYRTLPAEVFQAWEDGDSCAAELIQRAAEDYACLAFAATRRAGWDKEWVMVLGGGVIKTAPTKFFDLCRKEAAKKLPKVKVQQPEHPPELGAAVLAAYKGGQDPQLFYDAIMKEKY